MRARIGFGFRVAPGVYMFWRPSPTPAGLRFIWNGIKLLFGLYILLAVLLYNLQH